MSFFSLFSSAAERTESNLEQIQSIAIQNRIEGDRDIYQQGDVINNYFNTNKRKSNNYTPPIDASSLSLKEQGELTGVHGISYVGRHIINGVSYDFGGDEDDIADMTTKDWEVYGSYENWVSDTVSKDYFEQTPALISDYGSYSNLKKGLLIEDKAKGGIFGVSRSTRREVELANMARKIQREEESEKLRLETERFKKKSEADMKKQGASIVKHTDIQRLSNTIKDFNKKERKKIREESEANNNLLEEMKVQMAEMSRNREAPQITAKSVANEMMDEFRRLQSNTENSIGKNRYVDVEVIAR